MRVRIEGIGTALFVSFFWLPIAWALDCPVPDTGQTKCYDDEQEITCPHPGEPFYGQDAQYLINPRSYTKLDDDGNDLSESANEWVIVLDNVTNLLWEMKTDDGSIHDKGNDYLWEDAQNIFIVNLNESSFGGISDWRLPTIVELSSIVDRDTFEPSINTDYFPETEEGKLWSITTPDDDGESALVLDFNDGTVGCIPKTGTSHVRAVYGREQPSHHFIYISEGIIADTSTGLMWERDTAPGKYNWGQALSYCTRLTLDDYTDWRLPDVNELQSLIDYSKKNPSIDTDYFPATPSSSYWSSTTYTDDPGAAWCIDFVFGNVLAFTKSSLCYVRAVRGGESVSSTTTTSTGVETSSSSSSTTTAEPISTTTTTDCWLYIDVSPPEGGTTSPAPGSIFIQGCSPTTVEAIANHRYVFSHWEGDAEGSDNPITIEFGDEPSMSIVAVFVPDFCPIERLYGEDSKETAFLRYFRENVLSKTPEGRQLIKLYYQWSPAIVEAMERDEEFKEEVKEVIDGVLPLIREEIK